MKNLLSSLVTGAAAKRLSPVEADPSTSNQHEFNGVHALRHILGEAKRTFAARFIYLGTDEDDVTVSDGFVTWYDARKGHPTRSEYRLYFPATDASSRMASGDLAVFLTRPDGTLLIAFTTHSGTLEHQLLWLFGLSAPDNGVDVAQVHDAATEIGFAAREILTQLGIEPAAPPVEEESQLDVLTDLYGAGFPPTAEFSAFARDADPSLDPMADPDGTLIGWLEREEALFRHLERHLVLERLRIGFRDDVDAFISFSLSVQNRRKSRVGYALEHHVAAVLHANGVSFTRGAITERTSKPDFLLPSIDCYRDLSFAPERLTMLATKSTCKDRWRQVLTEADRIPAKHLLTIEPGISVTQTDEMSARGVTLVIPSPLLETFGPGQRKVAVSLADFLSLVRERELRI